MGSIELAFLSPALNPSTGRSTYPCHPASALPDGDCSSRFHERFARLLRFGPTSVPGRGSVIISVADPQADVDVPNDSLDLTMTAYELADLAQSNFANGTSAFAVFLSVVSAYIVAAYLVGAKLTRIQSRIVTILFLLISIFNSWTIAAYASGGARLSQLASPDDPNQFFRPGPWVAPLIGIACLLIVVMALKFMWDVRHPKTKSSD